MQEIPKTMHAAAIDRFGGPQALSIHSMPVPAHQAREVLIRLDTAGVAGWDADMRDGWSPGGRRRFPLVLGTEGGGTVVAVGSRVRRFKIGDRVYASDFNKGGFYADYVAVDEKNVSRVPKKLDLKHAGAIPITGNTALQGIDDALHVKKGENVIIHGAAGGVGSLAVQFAKLRGARVIATASGKDGLALVRRLGADMVVDGKRGDILAAARRFAPSGVDAVLAFVGGKELTRCIDALRRGGRVAYPHGVEPAPRKRRGIKLIPYDGEIGIREFAKLNRAIEKARLNVPIAATYKLADAAKAHERLAKGHVLGKIVLQVCERQDERRAA